MPTTATARDEPSGHPEHDDRDGDDIVDQIGGFIFLQMPGWLRRVPEQDRHAALLQVLRDLQRPSARAISQRSRYGG